MSPRSIVIPDDDDEDYPGFSTPHRSSGGLPELPAIATLAVDPNGSHGSLSLKPAGASRRRCLSTRRRATSPRRTALRPGAAMRLRRAAPNVTDWQAWAMS